MKTLARFVLLLAVIAGGVWFWMVLFPSPEKVIRGRLEKLAKDASVQPGQGYLPRMAGAQAVGGYIAATVEINIDIPGHRENTTLSRDEIVQGLMAAKFTGGMTVTIQDITVSVDADKETAQAEGTVQIHVPSEPDLMIQQMKFTLRKIDGKWLVTRVQTIRTFTWKSENAIT